MNTLLKHCKVKEGEVQKDILSWLLYQGIFAWRNNTVGVFDPIKKTFRKPASATKGIADIIGIMPDGRFLAIEVKRPKTELQTAGKPSIEQEHFIKTINDAGGLAFFAYSVDDVIREISESEYVIE